MRYVYIVCIFSLSLFSSLVRAQVPAAIPDRFTSIVLGSELETVKMLLQAHTLFNYRGDPDISLKPSDKQPLIETQGQGFMSAGIFQFRDERLYSIILRLDEAQIDYFTMYSLFQGKYGEPSYLDPQLSYWEQGGRRLVLEKPVVIKYLDMDTFNQIRAEGAASEGVREYSRKAFLDNF